MKSLGILFHAFNVFEFFNFIGKYFYNALSETLSSTIPIFLFGGVGLNPH
jgi:hypothetical protein